MEFVDASRMQVVEKIVEVVHVKEGITGRIVEQFVDPQVLTWIVEEVVLGLPFHRSRCSHAPWSSCRRSHAEGRGSNCRRVPSISSG